MIERQNSAREERRRRVQEKKGRMRVGQK